MSPPTVTVIPIVTFDTLAVPRPGLMKTAVHVVELLQLTLLSSEPELNTVSPGVVLKPVPVSVTAMSVGVVVVLTVIVFGEIPVIVGKTLNVNSLVEVGETLPTGAVSGTEPAASGRALVVMGRLAF